MNILNANQHAREHISTILNAGARDINSEEYKREFGFTISDFSGMVSSFDHWSFPKEIRILGAKLSIALAKWKLANMGYISEDANKLKREQYDLFAKIQRGIIKWYDTVIPESEKTSQPINYYPHFNEDAENINRVLNRLYFGATRGFDYLLPE